jgi:hypothetical protein
VLKTCAGLDASPTMANVRGPPRYAPIWTNSAAALPYGRSSRLLGSSGRECRKAVLFALAAVVGRALSAVELDKGTAAAMVVVVEREEATVALAVGEGRRGQEEEEERVMARMGWYGWSCQSAMMRVSRAREATKDLMSRQEMPNAPPPRPPPASFLTAAGFIDLSVLRLKSLWLDLLCFLTQCAEWSVEQECPRQLYPGFLGSSYGSNSMYGECGSSQSRRVDRLQDDGEKEVGDEDWRRKWSRNRRSEG